ncbi:MAG: hypothetical protein ACLQHT_03030 [Terracidiphilus sp.]
MMRKTTILLAELAVAAGLTGCWVHVDKNSNGADKNVQVDTPFGGIHVNTNQTTASDLGLPVYPGAAQRADDDKHKSADVHLGFGEWEMRVRAVSYSTSDTQEQVAAFYRKALGRYGDVITCQGNQPVGTPTKTSEGLTCSGDGYKRTETETNGKTLADNGGVKVQIGHSTSRDCLELKAGSKRHQHIVGFEEPEAGKTRFALVALDLPAGLDNNPSKSD